MIFIHAASLLCWIGFLFWIHKKIKPFSEEGEIITTFDERVQVLIAFRNEAENLEACLLHLNASKGFQNKLSVLMVDDHSDDQSLEVIKASARHCSNLSIEILPSQGKGKKAALLTGVAHVKEGWIFLTDADCFVRPTTIGSLHSAAVRSDADAVFGPVLYKVGRFWDRLLAYENLNTQTVSEAFVSIGKPTMVNGGNMLLHTSLLPVYLQSLKNGRTSGDDVFFAQALDKVQFSGAYSEVSAVDTRAPENFKALIQQRIRWASKYPAYRGVMLRMLPAFIFLLNALFVTIWFAWITASSWLNVWLLLLVLKWLIEFSFHHYWFKKYAFRAPILDGLILSALFPIYFLWVGMASLVLKRFQWKGRSYDR
ncbi:MAG: glycosyltransferase [Cryomorphaceae bacterium]